jgi:heptaprenyl diphosphate synthase
VYNVDRAEPDYFASIDGKTAALFATACRIGGIVADLPREQIETLTTFGRQYGMAFQVVDDILDLIASEEELGKPVGHDLVEGVYTLPVLRALGGPNGEALREILGVPLDDAAKDEARSIVLRSGGVEVAVEIAQGFVDDALGSLEQLDRTPAADGLAATARHLIGRVTVSAG